MIFRSIKLAKNSYSAAYSKVMYQAWKNNPDHVHQDWTVVFNNQKNGAQESSITSSQTQKQKSLALSAYMLIRYYKTRGHQRAELDPLQLSNFKQFGKVIAKSNLDYDLNKNKILNESNLDQPFTFPKSPVFQTKIAQFLQQKSQWTLREIHQRLQKIYSDNAGLEFMHITDADQRCWLMNEFEKIPHVVTSKDEKLYILQELTQSESFNVFLNDKLKTSKRFGVQGLDAMICGLNKLVQEAAKSGVEYIGLGMAHRGRLNALANVFNKPLVKIFAEFQQNVDKQSWGNSGDVKYHLGTTTEKQVAGKTVRLSILPNPSHLQAVNPVLMGHIRAVKDSLNNEQKTLGVLIHGDSALAGQGVVYQCLQSSYLNNYNINGIIHIVANNQIGFTTTPAQARTGLYCTDIAKSIQAPIIHVNSDEPQLVNKIISLAIAYRQKFKKDIFIDIIGYRRYGHNEQDQPAFTQPMMYQTISNKPPVYNIYKQKLIKQGIVTQQEVKQIWDKHYINMKLAYTQSLKSTFDITKWRTRVYHSVVDFSKLGTLSRTGLNKDELKLIGEKVTHVPQTFNIHPNIKKIYEQRRKSIEEGNGIDFATAESLAFGSLLKEGFDVRFSGQDVERGTFSHRHAALIDQKTQQKYFPLHNLLPSQQKQRFHIQNSLLSEYAAMGFEYGYSLTNPNTLTVWQAQFGDFSNGAQIMVDNYVTSGQSKWNTQSGIVLNLPHGMDGQGPQHSSGRMQRYLQMMNDSWVSLVKNGHLQTDEKALRHTNMSVICCSTAKNIFHSYRRQIRRNYRKPLLSFVNKKLLKLKDAGTSFQQLNTDKFDTIIDDPNPKIQPKRVKKVILLYGQAYYSVLQKNKEMKSEDVALVRIEQIAPLHYQRLVQVLTRYPNASQFIWFQEQHKNSGAWSYVYPRISVVLQLLKKDGKIKTDLLECVSRKTSASSAAGKKKQHEKQQVQILNKLFQK